jgi:hypothetical protein
MKILAKKRLTAAVKPIEANVIYSMFMKNRQSTYDLMGDYEITSDSLLKLAHETDLLELLAKYWIRRAKGLTGNLDADLEYYGGDPSRNIKKTPIGFINWLRQDANFGDIRPAMKVLRQEYLDLAKTKYRKFVYPVIDTYSYDQIFPEFKDFDAYGPDADRYNQTGKYSELEDYVKSTGFR